MKSTIMNSALRSTRSFKKASYRILRKLHKLESKKSLINAPKIGNNISIILSIKELIKILQLLYSDTYLGDKMAKLIELLDKLCIVSLQKGYIDRKILVSCLKQHTYIFNMIITNKLQFIVDQNTVFLWNIKLLPLYIQQFKNKF